MATDNITDKNTLKSWFRRGLKPLEVQFHAWMDSYWHKSESIPVGSIEGLENTLNQKAEDAAMNQISSDLEYHKTDESAHQDVRNELKEHTSNYEIHKSSEQIRSEIVDEDIPDTIARNQIVDEKLAVKVDKITGSSLVPDNEIEKLSNLGKYVSKVADIVYDGKTQLNITVANPSDRGNVQVESLILDEATAEHNGLLSVKHYNALLGLQMNESYLDKTGTPSATWQLSKDAGPKIKNSQGAFELRNARDDEYAGLTVKDLTIKGNVTQEGESFITKAETVEVKDNTLLLNSGETGAGVTKGVAGVEIDRGSLPAYNIYFDESDDRFKVGQGNDLWPIMLRNKEADLVGGAVLVWDSVTKKAKTGKNMDTELNKYLPLSGGTMTGCIAISDVLDGEIIKQGTSKILSLSKSSNTLSLGDASKYKVNFTSVGDLLHNGFIIYDSGNLNLSLLAKKTDIPTALKSPAALTFTGGATGSYDGSVAKTVNIPTTLPASDVYAWAKAPAKPVYSWSEIGSKPSFATESWVNTNAVTIGGTQTITGTKTFTAPVTSSAGFYDTSDKRLKSGIKSIELKSEKIQLYEFDKLDKHSVGVIAQEVESLYPWMVRDGEDGYKIVNYNEVLIMKCAELEAEIEAVRRERVTLEERLTRLEELLRKQS